MERISKILQKVFRMLWKMYSEENMISESTMHKATKPMRSMTWEEKECYLIEMEKFLKTMKAEDELLEYLKQYETIGGI